MLWTVTDTDCTMFSVFQGPPTGGGPPGTPIMPSPQGKLSLMNIHECFFISVRSLLVFSLFLCIFTKYTVARIICRKKQEYLYDKIKLFT